MEQWLEVTIRTASGGIDLLCAELTEAGFDSFVIDDSEQFRQFLDGARAYWDYVDEKLAARMRDLSQVRLYLAEETAEAQLAELRALLAELGLGEVGDKRVRDWSGGMKRRLALARALLAPSDALALDEPFTGLDADNRAAAQRCVARAAREKIVLLVSHEDDALTGAEVRLQ